MTGHIRLVTFDWSNLTGQIRLIEVDWRKLLPPLDFWRHEARHPGRPAGQTRPVKSDWSNPTVLI